MARFRPSLPLLAALASAALGAALYLNTLGNGFVLDDVGLILENPLVREKGRWREIFTSTYWGPGGGQEYAYRPVSSLTLVGNHALGGDNPWGYHLANVALHGVITFFFYFLARGLGMAAPGALAAALLFAAHPVHTEAVAGAVNRTALLASLFFFPALALHARGYTVGRWGPGALYPLSLLLFALSLFSYEGAVAYPLAVLLHDLLFPRGPVTPPSPRLRSGQAWRHGREDAGGTPALQGKAGGDARAPVTPPSPRLRSGQARRPPTQPPPSSPPPVGGRTKEGGTGGARISLWPYVGVGAVLLFFVLVRAWVVGALIMPGRQIDFFHNPLAFLPWGERMMTAVAILALYARLLLFPLHLSGDYSYNQIPSVLLPLEPRFLAGVGTAALVLWLTWRYRSKAPRVSFALGFTALSLFPLTNIPFLIGNIMAERFLYLPSAGLSLLLGEVFGLLWDKGARARRALLAGGLVVVLAGYGARTFVRNLDWRDELTFWRAATRTAPESTFAWMGLGHVLLNEGDLARAEEALLRARAIYPGTSLLNRNLGALYYKMGRYDEAARYFALSLRINPEYPRIHLLLGRALLQLGRKEEALAAIGEALKRDPRVPGGALALAEALEALGRRGEAAASLEEAIARGTDRADPARADLLNQLGFLRAGEKRWAEARGLFKRAVALAPKDARFHFNLGLTLQEEGKLEGAAAAFREAARLDPRLEAARQRLAEAEKLLAEERAKAATPGLLRASHILLKSRGEAERVLEELKRGASFEELARKFSSDATGARGGDIGFFRPGELLPAFEEAAKKLRVGEVSGVVESPAGFHVIRRTR